MPEFGVFTQPGALSNQAANEVSAAFWRTCAACPPEPVILRQTRHDTLILEHLWGHLTNSLVFTVREQYISDREVVAPLNEAYFISHVLEFDYLPET